MGLASTAASGAAGYLKSGLGVAAKNPALLMGGVGAAFSVKQQVDNGNSLSTSIFKAGVEGALYASNPILMTAVDLAPMAYQGVVGAHQFRKRRAEEMFDRKNNNYGRVGGGFVDTTQAQTMRQAAVQQIQGNKLNARSALGGEARIFAGKY